MLSRTVLGTALAAVSLLSVVACSAPVASTSNSSPSASPSASASLTRPSLSVATLDATVTQLGPDRALPLDRVLVMVLAVLFIAAVVTMIWQMQHHRQLRASRARHMRRAAIADEGPVDAANLMSRSASATLVRESNSVAEGRTQERPPDATGDVVVEQVELARRRVGRFEIAFAATLAKDLRMPNTNEDAWSLSPRGIGIALFDGASESFAARRWSHLLAAHWASGNPTWLEAAQLEYGLFMSTMDLTWAQEAAAARGSFATFVSVCDVLGAVEVTGIGDSCAIWVRGTQIVDAYPLNEARQFTSAPEALHSDSASLEEGVRQLASRRVLWPIEEGPVEVWLATDAVAAWLLTEEESMRTARISMVRELKSLEDFRLLVEQERESGAINVDDSTLVRVEVKEGA